MPVHPRQDEAVEARQHQGRVLQPHCPTRIMKTYAKYVRSQLHSMNGEEEQPRRRTLRDSFTPSWMSWGPRKSAWPPRIAMPVSVETLICVNEQHNHQEGHFRTTRCST
jgi:hypothetical protein